MKEKEMSESSNEIRRIIDRLHEVQEDDSMDNSQISKLMILARDGLVSEDEAKLVRQAMKTMDSGRLPTPQQRTVLLNMLGTLADIITSDMSMYQRVRTVMRQRDNDDEENKQA